MTNLILQRARSLLSPRPTMSLSRMGGDRAGKRLMIAAAFSTLFHAGLFMSAAGIQSRQKSDQPTATVGKKLTTAPGAIPPKFSPAPAEAPTISAAERDFLLNKYRAEKKEFVSSLLLDIHRQEQTISFTGFMLKSDLLDWNIKALESGSGELLDEAAINSQFQHISSEAKKRTDQAENTEDKLAELHGYAQRRMFKGYLKHNRNLLNIFHDKTYNCTSSTEFVSLLENELLGLANFGVVLQDPSKDPAKAQEGHVLSWFRNKEGLWQIENTSGKEPRLQPFTKGLRVPIAIFKAAYLVRSGVKVEQLPPYLARYYKKGVGQGGFPVAGESTDLPEPPDHLLPNPYFILDNDEIIKKAQIMNAELSLALAPATSDPNTLQLSIIHLPEGVDWCQEARINFVRSIIIARPTGLIDRFYSANGKNLPLLQYSTALKFADLAISDSLSEDNTCSSKGEHIEFEAYAQALLTGAKPNNYKMTAALSDPTKSRILLINIYGNNNIDIEARRTAIGILSYIASPEDLGLFKDVLLNDTDQTIRMHVTFALREMKGIFVDKAAAILRQALEQEKNELVRLGIFIALGNLGYWREILPYLQAIKGPLTVNGKEYSSLLGWKISLVNRIIIPDNYDKPSLSDIDLLNELIDRENNMIIKAVFISVLANLGETEIAKEHINKIILPYLRVNGSDAKQVILALGKIKPPIVKDDLLAIFDLYPHLAPEIGDVLIRWGIRSEKVIAELKKIVFIPVHEMRVETDLNTDDYKRRTYAAHLFIQMGEL